MTFTVHQEDLDEDHSQTKQVLWTNYKTQSKLLLPNPGVLNCNYASETPQIS